MDLLLHPGFWDDHDAEARVLVNPRLGWDVTPLEAWAERQPELRGHLLLGTSGSTGVSKWMALSRHAFLASAHAVNSHLNSTGEDRWLLALPLFHVGGLGVLARARLSGSEVAVVPVPWSAAGFVETCRTTQATLSALTPTQISDLVAASLTAPASLRALVVGGGALSRSDARAARRLGWPVLQSYGLTEAASQVATAEPGEAAEESGMVILSHWETRTNPQGLLELRGPALASGWVEWMGSEGILHPLAGAGGWFTTRDLVRLSGNRLEILGRADRCVKVGGELVSLDGLQEVWESVSITPGWIAARPDERLGHVVVLVLCEGRESDTAASIASFDAKVAPFERIRAVIEVPRLPRSPLGKPLWRELGLK